LGPDADSTLQTEGNDEEDARVMIQEGKFDAAERGLQ